MCHIETTVYLLSYLLSLPRIAPDVVSECWKDIFTRLHVNKVLGDMFLHERDTNQSLVRLLTGGTTSVATAFPSWLYTVAFDKNGLIMKHALDIAITLDAMAYDKRLGLHYLIPVSLILALRSNTSDTAVDMFVDLITRLDRARYLVLNLVAAAEEKWPGIFQTILERVFSKAIAMHIANSGGSINVEKILTNLSMLFEEAPDSSYINRPGFNAFQSYMKQRCRQVLLLFVNHPSMECRALGYRVLSHSHFWEEDSTNVDSASISKLLMDAWFRHMKSRYTFFKENDESLVLDELEHLNANSNSTNKDQQRGTISALQQNGHPNQRRPPQFLKAYPQLQDMLELQDQVYIDNIERSANLFCKFQEQSQYTPEHKSAIGFHILSHLSARWPSATASIEAYDEALPKNIPSARDIAIGNTFKDHPVLFLIVEKCANSSRSAGGELLRSILVYFIVFWHMDQVVQAATTLKYATQLEETARLIILMKNVREIMRKAEYSTNNMMIF
ncbi:hypothetical protein BJV82DRAFT_512386 [Fennellomyces sp. T-0311]|nr:hypothetical protein BJV82DRAFT_512386 [Fennellomyces sp. T-0311]